MWYLSWRRGDRESWRNDRVHAKKAALGTLSVVAVRWGRSAGGCCGPGVSHLHPEFGLLCPSPKFRRWAKVTLACLAGSIIIGALALQVSHERGADGALLIAHGDAAATNAEVAPTVGRAAMTAEISPVPQDS